MYKTTSILALGLFLTLAPQAFAQTQSDDELQIQQDTGETTTQDQTTQSTDTEAEGETVIEQQATDEPETMGTEQQATDEPETMGTEQQATDEPETMGTEQQAIDEPETMDTEQQATDEPESMDTEQQAAGQDQPEGSEAAITGQIAEQEEGTFLTGNMIGAEVQSQDGESIGKISDLIITEDGRVQGVVVGVGGFLGIGEKRVAIGMGSIQMQPSPDNPDEFVIISDQSRAELEEGTAFKTTADMRAEEEAAQAQQEAEQAQPATPPAPAPAE